MKTEDSCEQFKYKVAAFYDFISIIDQEILLIKEELTNIAAIQEIKGTILIASEGVNGTVCGTENAIIQFIETLEKLLKVLNAFAPMQEIHEMSLYEDLELLQNFQFLFHTHYEYQ